MDHDRASATKARILGAALSLFNAEGVGALSAVDIAADLGISPGHLYYHFKGKPEILAALIDAYRAEVDMVLEAGMEACRGAGATLETLWTHLHILMEEAWDARFVYREAGALALRYPDIAVRIRRVAVAEREALRIMLAALQEAGALRGDPQGLDDLAHILVTAIGFHAIELELEGDGGSPRDRVARAAAQVIGLVALFRA